MTRCLSDITCWEFSIISQTDKAGQTVLEEFTAKVESNVISPLDLTASLSAPIWTGLTRQTQMINTGNISVCLALHTPPGEEQSIRNSTSYFTPHLSIFCSAANCEGGTWGTNQDCMERQSVVKLQGQGQSPGSSLQAGWTKYKRL